VPVLVSEMVGARGLVVEGRNGWVVPVEDREALTRRMLACARDPAAVRALSPQARASARAATWEAYHERFAELLRRLLERGR
jgi:glycosyltransferase involved in cell wall biosynthesis